MKRNIITISDSGSVIVPNNNNIRMTVHEIANLFEIFYQTAKSSIRTIEKSGIASGDYSMSCMVERMKIYPDYYGLDMVIAMAFRIKSKNAKIMREWIIQKTCQPDNILQFQKSENEYLFSLN